MAKQIDRHTETWQAVEAWAKQRRAVAIADLIQGGSSPGHDDKMRGEIRAMDDLLDLADRQAPPPHTPVAY